MLTKWNVCQQSRFRALTTLVHTLLHHIARQSHIPKGDFIDVTFHRREGLKLIRSNQTTQIEWCCTIQLTKAYCLCLSCQFTIHVSRSHVGRTVNHECQLVPFIVGIALIHDDARCVTANGQFLILHTNEEFFIGIRLILQAIARSHDGEVFLRLCIEPKRQRVALFFRSPFEHGTIQCTLIGLT